MKPPEPGRLRTRSTHPTVLSPYGSYGSCSRAPHSGTMQARQTDGVPPPSGCVHGCEWTTTSKLDLRERRGCAHDGHWAGRGDKADTLRHQRDDQHPV